MLFGETVDVFHEGSTNHVNCGGKIQKFSMFNVWAVRVKIGAKMGYQNEDFIQDPYHNTSFILLQLCILCYTLNILFHER
jgi:hypothetical protein